jgi:hypothetical protein
MGGGALRSRAGTIGAMGVVVLLAAVALICVGARTAAGSGSAISQVMTAMIADGDFGFNLTFADGSPVGEQDMPGAVIPSGSYLIDVSDTTTEGNFDLEGNGVDLATGIEQTIQTTWSVTFLPCSLYSYRNDQSSAGNEWFQTSASATGTAACPASSLVIPTAPGAPPTSQRPIKITHGSQPSGTNLSAIGTAIHSIPFRGTIRGSLSANGGLVLSFHGAPARTLLAGRYDLDIVDSTPSRGFALVKPLGSRLDVTSSRFVGRRKTSLLLSLGVWRAAITGTEAQSRRLTVRQV